MGKNVRLANIYIKIYNKQPLMMDDLAFLAKYDPECFEKTCRNLVYNEPEAKSLIETGKPDSAAEELPEEEGEKSAEPIMPEEERETSAEPELPEEKRETSAEPELSEEEKLAKQRSKEIGLLLENLKKMEGEELQLQKLSLEHVKNLLGSLYMEMMFPHNDRYRTFEMAEDEEYVTFNKKA